MMTDYATAPPFVWGFVALLAFAILRLVAHFVDELAQISKVDRELAGLVPVPEPVRSPVAIESPGPSAFVETLRGATIATVAGMVFLAILKSGARR